MSENFTIKKLKGQGWPQAITIELNPKDAVCYSNRGLTYLNFKKYQEAIQDFDKAIELNPKDASYYSSRGIAYYNIGKYQQAIRDHTNVIELELEPKNLTVYAYYFCGTAYEKLGDKRKALEDLKSAARLGYKGAQELLRLRGINW